MMQLTYRSLTQDFTRHVFQSRWTVVDGHKVYFLHQYKSGDDPLVTMVHRESPQSAKSVRLPLNTPIVRRIVRAIQKADGSIAAYGLTKAIATEGEE